MPSSATSTQQQQELTDASAAINDNDSCSIVSCFSHKNPKTPSQHHRTKSVAFIFDSPESIEEEEEEDGSVILTELSQCSSDSSSNSTHSVRTLVNITTDTMHMPDSPPPSPHISDNCSSNEYSSNDDVFSINSADLLSSSDDEHSESPQKQYDEPVSFADFPIDFSQNAPVFVLQAADRNQEYYDTDTDTESIQQQDHPIQHHRRFDGLRILSHSHPKIGSNSAPPSSFQVQMRNFHPCNGSIQAGLEQCIYLLFVCTDGPNMAALNAEIENEKCAFNTSDPASHLTLSTPSTLFRHRLLIPPKQLRVQISIKLMRLSTNTMLKSNQVRAELFSHGIKVFYHLHHAGEHSLQLQVRTNNVVHELSSEHCVQPPFDPRASDVLLEKRMFVLGTSHLVQYDPALFEHNVGYEPHICSSNSSVSRSTLVFHSRPDVVVSELQMLHRQLQVDDIVLLLNCVKEFTDKQMRVPLAMQQFSTWYQRYIAAKPYSPPKNVGDHSIQSAKVLTMFETQIAELHEKHTKLAIRIDHQNAFTEHVVESLESSRWFGGKLITKSTHTHLLPFEYPPTQPDHMKIFKGGLMDLITWMSRIFWDPINGELEFATEESETTVGGSTPLKSEEDTELPSPIFDSKNASSPPHPRRPHHKRSVTPSSLHSVKNLLAMVTAIAQTMPSPCGPFWGQLYALIEYCFPQRVTIVLASFLVQMIAKHNKFVTDGDQNVLDLMLMQLQVCNADNDLHQEWQAAFKPLIDMCKSTAEKRSFSIEDRQGMLVSLLRCTVEGTLEDCEGVEGSCPFPFEEILHCTIMAHLLITKALVRGVSLVLPKCFIPDAKIFIDDSLVDYETEEEACLSSTWVSHRESLLYMLFICKGFGREYMCDTIECLSHMMEALHTMEDERKDLQEQVINHCNKLLPFFCLGKQKTYTVENLWKRHIVSLSPVHQRAPCSFKDYQVHIWTDTKQAGTFKIQVRSPDDMQLAAEKEIGVADLYDWDWIQLGPLWMDTISLRELILSKFVKSS
uniref:Uncharacterized protein n=1 Tax=Percolomonas cosmopolitus TaxID=63605 RepID=A0A7S1KLR3_9EUKA|mmetsp:Transcript_1131/g.3877  ORF Transcript_1131/g.3877 Transcript_1131/m.3877 type:complete len:1015 (+) Transcript_1131:333-3377(+)|eukprot:CAMPEP_0117434716 /NCGR_PEP_ID=MMETSP0759-20121206/95_1 /TAXON_ID=63605 /ORGANISM="Percolomonas cosmopolitus, Strain WS" /LENGTH=1014 /DNA_ID=CAMNT_0005226213 /DNA_START=639 /DNA_END=3683 /DNA_ORIENTATION=+